jgi:hypothetical protein
MEPMTHVTNRTQTIGVGVALALALVALVTALGSPARAAPTAGQTAGNVVVEKRVFYVGNGDVRNVTARCGKGTTVFSGGFASTGQHARVFVAGPSRGENGYVVYALVPPVNIRAGVTKETARITVVAWCARSAEPIVLGKP